MYPNNNSGQEPIAPTTPEPPVPPPPAPPKKPSRAFRILVGLLALYVIWSLVSLLSFAYQSGQEGTALTLGEILYHLLTTLITPVIVLGFYVVWKSFIASTKHHSVDSQKPRIESRVRRTIGLAICLLAIILPVYFIYNFFANPGPGSEFMVFGLPIFAVPIIYGLLGLRRLAQPPGASGEPSVASSPARNVGSQIINGLVYSIVAIIVAICLWIGYGFYQLRSYVAEDSKPRTVSLETALETISTCTYIDIKQSKKPNPSKGIVFRPMDGVHEVYDDAAWPKLVEAAKNVEGTSVSNFGDTCPAAKITPRK